MVRQIVTHPCVEELSPSCNLPPLFSLPSWSTEKNQAPRVLRIWTEASLAGEPWISYPPATRVPLKGIIITRNSITLCCIRRKSKPFAETVAYGFHRAGKHSMACRCKTHSVLGTLRTWHPGGWKHLGSHANLVQMLALPLNSYLDF